MSFFGGSTEVDVAVIFSRVIKDGDIPDILKDAVLSSVFKKADLVATIKDAINGGSYKNFEKAYNWAKNNAPELLPTVSSETSEIFNPTFQKNAVKSAIEQEIGQDVVLYGYRTEALCVKLLALHELTTNYAYNIMSREVKSRSNTRGVPVYLDKLVSHYLYDVPAGWSPENQLLHRENVGNREDVIGYPDAQKTMAQMTLVWEIDGQTHSEILEFDYPDWLPTRIYYQAVYRLANEGADKLRYWWYDPNTGTHPTLPVISASRDKVAYRDLGTTFPFAQFRENYTNLTSEALASSSRYQDTDKLVSLFQLDYQEMGDAIHANPDIADVQDSIMYLGVPTYLDSDIDLTDTTQVFAPPNPDPIFIEYLIRHYLWIDAMTLDAKVMGIFDFDYSETGVLFYPGELPQHNEYVANTVGFSAGISSTVTREMVPAFPQSALIDGVSIIPRSMSSLYASETTSYIPSWSNGISLLGARILYKKMTPSLAMAIPVRGHFLMKLANQSVISLFADTHAHIPIIRDVAHTMGLMDRSNLYYKSLHLLFAAVVYTHIAWYESNEFGALLTLAGIAFTLFGSGELITGIKEAFLASGMKGVAKIIVKTILVSAAFSLAFDLLVDIVGEEFALALATAALIIGVSSKFGHSVPGAEMWADKLLMAAAGISSAVSRSVEDLFTELQSDISDFLDEATERTKNLEEAAELLKHAVNVDPLTFVRGTPILQPGDSPDMYYRARLNQNPGVIAFDILENFYEISLSLPSVNDSLGVR